MTFDPGIPVKTQSPGLFPDQIHADLNRLKAMIEADHVFNNTAPMANDNSGIHKQVRMINKALPTGPLLNGQSGEHFAFANALGQSQEWYYNGTNLYLPETSIKCFVNFNGLTVVPTIRTGPLNVATVTRNGGVGRYKITYAVPFVPNANGQDYIVQISCRNFNTNLTVGQISSSTALSLAMTDTFVNIDTYDRSGSHIDCDYVGVTIFTYI